MSKDKLEKLLWSIALPGFGQILNQRYIKAFLFIFLEFLINVQANINDVIILSFHGKTQTAINQTDFQWLMFYPCLYFFTMWDAVKDAKGESSPLMFLPFVFAAYLSTVGVVYSSKLTILGILVGPIFSPILIGILGILVGIILMRFIQKTTN